MASLQYKPIAMVREIDARGGKINVNDLNAVIRTLTQGHMRPFFSGSLGVHSLAFSGGNKLQIPESLQLWIGVIVEKGPNKEKDFIDARYWVVKEYVANEYLGKEPKEHKSDQIELKKWKKDDPLHRIIPVTNLAEIDIDPEGKGHTHYLPSGLHVLIFQIKDRSGLFEKDNPANFGPFTKYYMWSGFPQSQFVVVRNDPNGKPPGEDDTVIWVQSVVLDRKDNKHKIVGDKHLVFCYPGTFGRHFLQLITPEGIEEISSVVTVLDKELRDSEWYVFPRSRRGRIFIDEQGDTELSDCARVVR